MNTPAPDLRSMLSRVRTNTGEALLDLSNSGPVMLVFLRHTGCPFCREAMADVQRRREEIERRARVVFVHQAPEDEANASFFAAAGVGDIPRVSDPSRDLYNAIGLKRGSIWAVLGPYVWLRSIQAMLSMRRLGRIIGDVFQMPGVFIIHKGEIVGSFVHKSQASRPDYVGIACAMR
jgi:peroxiredoxin